MSSKGVSGDPARTSSLTQEQVVNAALAYIDENGLESFSMRSLARELNVYPTALYWHAGNREALLGMSIGRALLEIEPPDEIDHWQEWSREVARRFRAALHRHPNLASIVGSQMLVSAYTEFSIVELVLSKLAEAGFEGDSLVDAYNVMFGTVIGFVTLELAHIPPDKAWSAEMQDGVSAVRAEQYPTLAANIDRMANASFGLRWLPGTEVPLDRSFELMLRIVIGGLAALLPTSEV